MASAVWTEIKQIKNVKIARAVWEALTASYTQKVGEKTAKHHEGMWLSGGAAATYKPEGLAWWKDRCLSVANNIVDNASVKSAYIPPSDETLAWGGFLGGEHLSWTNQADKAEMDEMIAGKIRGLAA